MGVDTLSTVPPSRSDHPSPAAPPVDEAAAGAADRHREGARALARLTRPIATRLLIGRILAGLSAVLAIAPYIALVQLGDVLLRAWAAGSPPDADRVSAVLMVLVGTFVARLTLYYVALLVTHFADVKLGAVLRHDILDVLGRAPLSWFSATTSGRVRSAVQDDTATLHTLVAHQPVESTAAVVMPIALLAYAFVVDWRLGLLAIGTLPIYVAIYAWTMRGMGVKTAEMDVRLARISSTMVEFVSGITVVKAFGRVGEAHGRYLRANQEFGEFYLAWVGPLLRSSAIATAVIAPPVLVLVNLGGGAALAAGGWVTPAEVLTTTLIALVLPATMMVLGNTSWAYQLAGAAALRLVAVLDTPMLAEPAHPRTPASHDVVFDHVSFRYGDTVAADDVSLELAEGTVTALIGPSGSGKSTIATLLARFNDPAGGRVLLGGVDLRRITTEELYRRVAFVLQDPQLLRTSIRANIALARPGASDAEIEEAARAARIHDEIAALPDGYDTVLGEDMSLSGGQSQRVAIARALIADAPVLILDEATAFTDPESEALIQEAIDRLVVGRTVLVIAHRPASVRGADQIVVLDRGRVVAHGAHTELADEPHYRAMWERATSGTATLDAPAGPTPADTSAADPITEN